MQFDYVVIGAGSAGCAVAARLSENTSLRVALLEAGGRAWNPWLHVPVGYFKTMHDPATDWVYRTAPDPGLNGRSIEWPRGKVMGGSSAVNGLLYLRGQPEDYQHWRQLGNTGWGWDDVLPFFRKAEDWEHGREALHGAGGPLAVSEMRVHRKVCDRFIEAAGRIGLPTNRDFNCPSQEGVGYFHLTMRKGLRCSSSTAYLSTARTRRNLAIFRRCLVRQIVFDGRRAIGASIERGGKRDTVRAIREIILSAGAIGSPRFSSAQASVLRSSWQKRACLSSPTGRKWAVTSRTISRPERFS